MIQLTNVVMICSSLMLYFLAQTVTLRAAETGEVLIFLPTPLNPKLQNLLPTPNMQVY